MDGLNIRHLKLRNGDDVIALIAVKNDNSFIIERPVLVHINMLGGYQFVPWFPFTESKSVKVDKTQVISHVDVVEDVKEAYVQFALSLANYIRKLENKSDLEILRELEDKLMSTEESIPDMDLFDPYDKKRVLH